MGWLIEIGIGLSAFHIVSVVGFLKTGCRLATLVYARGKAKTDKHDLICVNLLISVYSVPNLYSSSRRLGT